MAPSWWDKRPAEQREQDLTGWPAGRGGKAYRVFWSFQMLRTLILCALVFVLCVIGVVKLIQAGM